MRIARPVDLFGLDLRSLAIFRIGLALVVLADLAIRLGSLEAHYTDDGVLTRATLNELASNPWFFTLHVFPTWPAQLFLFLVAAGFALALLLGHRTRLVTVATWVLTVSLQNRNTMILEGADQMLRLALFWGMFLPLGERWSLDARRHGDGHLLPRRVFGAHTLALHVQVVCVYFFSGLLKCGAPWTEDGTALEMAIQLDLFTEPRARAMLALPPEVLRQATLAIRWLEIVGPFLLFCPLATRFFRATTIGAFVAFHLAIWLLFSVGWFSWMGCVLWSALLPGTLWDRIAAAGITRRLRGALRSLGAMGGPTTSAGGGYEIELRPRLLTSGCVLVLTLYVVTWNVGTLPDSRFGTGRQAWLGLLLRLDQAWNMFAPFPYTDDGWLVLEAELGDGRRLDLMPHLGGDEPQPFDGFVKPEDVAGQFPSSRWQKYLTRLWAIADAEHRRPFAAWLERHWNARHPVHQHIRKLRIWYVLEPVRLGSPEEAEPKLLLERP